VWCECVSFVWQSVHDNYYTVH